MTGLFFKGVAGAMVGVVLCQQLKSSQREIGTLLSLGVCIFLAWIVFSFLKPILSAMESLEHLGNVDEGMFRILLKAVGMTLVCEVSSAVCADSGNAALGKLLELLGTAATIYISLPLLTALTDFIREILGAA